MLLCEAFCKRGLGTWRKVGAFMCYHNSTNIVADLMLHKQLKLPRLTVQKCGVGVCGDIYIWCIFVSGI